MIPNYAVVNIEVLDNPYPPKENIVGLFRYLSDAETFRNHYKPQYGYTVIKEVVLEKISALDDEQKEGE